MPRTLSSLFKTLKNKQEGKAIIYLYELEYESGKWLYLCDYKEDITFAGTTYTAFPITHDKWGESRENKVEEIRISVANVNRVISSYIEQYDGFRGHEIKVKAVFPDHLDDPSCYIENKYVIDSVIVNEQTATFRCTQLNLTEIEIPACKFLNICQWVFKSPECGYSGAETTCNKTLTRCKELGNQKRFGGFPGIRQYRRWIF